jgi:hypothetical protein
MVCNASHRVRFTGREGQNICCLIQEQCELGIEPIFWPESEREAIEASGYLKVSRA